MRASVWLARVCCSVLLVLVFGSPARANLFQRHVLDASINLGWVTETLAREGRTAANQADVALGMALAEAHVRELMSLLRAPYQDLDFSGVLDALLRWDGATSGVSAGHAAARVRGIHQRFRELLSVYFDARTQRLVRDGNCDSQFADVGFHFGRAHIAGLRGDADAMTGHLGNMRQAIRGGLQQDQLKLCGFGVPVDWDRVPVLRGDASADGFWWSLVLIQAIALQAGRGGGSVGSVPVPLPPPVGPPPAPTPPPTPTPTPIVPAPQHHKLFDRVAQQPSERFRGNTFPSLRIVTSWDSTPYTIAPSVEITFFVGSGQTVFLAGDAAGVGGWEVDNFLFVEILQGGRRGAAPRFVIGWVDPVYFGNELLPRVGDSRAAFSPSESDITAFFEPGTQARVRVHALDYGGLGFVSEVFLVVR